MPAPLYDVLLVAHVAVALIGFGSIAVAGLSARRGRQVADPASDARLARFFAPGVDWPGRLIFLVPVFGLAMLLGGDRSDLPRLWPWIALACWTGAVGMVTARGWPSERAAQAALARARGGEAEAAGEFRAACESMERSVAVVELLFVVALVLMIWQPGS